MTVLILSYTVNASYYQMLKNCIESIGSGYNIVVVETNSSLKGKDLMLPAKFVFPEEEFNYNKYLNIGFNEVDDDKVIISNNDVVYEEGCIADLFNALDVYDSVSPVEKKTTGNIEGNKVGVHVKGWCIGINMNVYKKMGQWDEAFSFWYQDNDYCNFLKKHNLKHALIGSAVAHHKTAASHTLLKNTYAATHGLLSALEVKWSCDG